MHWFTDHNMHQTSPQNGSRDYQPIQVVLGIWIFLRVRQFHQLIKHSADNIHHPGHLSYRVVNRKTANFAAKRSKTGTSISI